MNQTFRLPPLVAPGFLARRAALGQAIAIGLCTGLATSAFRLLMGAVGTWRNQAGLAHGAHWWVLPLIGAGAGAIAGHLVAYVAPEAKGSGIPHVKLALARPATPLRLRMVVVKLVGAAVGIGGGLSLGREGPSVQIGAGLGAWLARGFDGSRLHRRQLIAAGAGAGVAAAFNAPIAGVLFVVEEMVQDFSSLTLGSAVLASVTASVTARALGGGTFVYTLPPAGFGPAELPWYALLGVVCGLGGPCFTWAILKALAASRAARRWLPHPWHPAVVGLFTGALGERFPAVMGGSYSLVERSLFGSIHLAVLPFIFLGKLGCTALAYGSGAPGGIFSPSLVLGAVLGLTVAQAAHAGLPGLALAPTGLAFAGMGAFFAATARAPITAIVLVFEMTGDYAQVMPLMLAVIVATLVSERLSGESIYHALLRFDGVQLDPAPHLGGLHDALASSAMSRHPEVLREDEPLAAVVERFACSRHGGFPVLDAVGRPVGMLTKDDLLAAIAQDLPPDTPAREIGSFPGLTLAEDATLVEAWELFSRHGVSRVAIVAAGEPDRLVGILTQVDLFRRANGVPAPPADP